QARHRPALRPAGQPHPRPDPHRAARRLGARLLPRLPERARRLRHRLVEPRQLVRRRGPPPARQDPDRRAHRPRLTPLTTRTPARTTPHEGAARTGVRRVRAVAYDQEPVPPPVPSAVENAPAWKWPSRCELLSKKFTLKYTGVALNWKL